MVKMLAVIVCLAGILAILATGEILYKQKILEGEYLRKFIHISSGTFIAFWPWLISWHAIQIIGLMILMFVLLNYRVKKIHVSGDIKRQTYGLILFPVAIIACALLTHNKFFFALAVLHLALADGLAAVNGITYGKKFKYKIFHQVKTLTGTMTFWLTSLSILGVGLLFAHDFVSFNHYVFLLIFLPPILAVLKNLTVLGLDNMVVPVAVILALRLAA